MLASLLLAAVLGAAPTPAPADTVKAVTWRIDTNHSELLFRVRHLVSRVTGTFTDWEGRITGEPPAWQNGAVRVVVRTRSIDTNHERRDTHLRSADFFDVEQFPEMTFESTGVELAGERVTLSGNLSIRGTTRPVVLTGTFLGISPGRNGRDRIGFEVSTQINRLDYGLTWNRAAEGGGLVLADEVTIAVTVAAVKEVGEAGN